MTTPKAAGMTARLARIGRRGASAALILNVLAAVASFVSTTILARMGGAATVGNYALAISTGTTLSVLALLGLDRIAMRTIAGDLRLGMTSEAHGMLTRVRDFALISVAVVAICYLVALSYLPLFRKMSANHVAMHAAAGSIATVALLRLGLACLRASGRQVLAQALDNGPTLGFAILLGVGAVYGMAPSSTGAVLLFVGLQAVAAAVVWYLLHEQAKAWGPPAFDQSMRLMSVGLPMMLVVFVHSFSDWVVVSSISRDATAAEVGAFRVAAQIVSIPTMVIGTFETYYSAIFAGHFRARRPDLAWRTQRRANRAVIAANAPLLLLVAIFAEPLLGFAFGPEFVGAATPLRIMAMGQMVNVLTGPIGGMLTMSGHERVLLKLALLGLATLLLLCLVLIPTLGLTGAAIAWSANVVIRTLGSYLFARRAIPRHATPEISGKT